MNLIGQVFQGSDKLKLLKNHPEKLELGEVLSINTCAKVVQLWKDFFVLYVLIISLVSRFFEKISVVR